MTPNRSKLDNDSGVYLGSTAAIKWARSQAHSLQVAKNTLLLKYFWSTKVARPDPKSCNPLDPVSIYTYLARENLECAVSCDPTTKLDRTREICRIISGELLDGEYIHLEIHKNYEKGLEKYKDTPPERQAHEILAYFDVWIKESPQNTKEHEAILSLVQRYIQLAQQIVW